jgi:hypothetical protein
MRKFLCERDSIILATLRDLKCKLCAKFFDIFLLVCFGNVRVSVI